MLPSDEDLIHPPQDGEERRSATLQRVLLAATVLLLAVPIVYLRVSSSPPPYLTTGTLWFTGGSADRAALDGAEFVGLFRSYAVLEPVVEARRLYLPTPADDGPAPEPSPQAVREAAADLSERLSVRVDGDGRFVKVSLGGTDAEATATTLNAILDKFVEVVLALHASEREGDEGTPLVQVLDYAVVPSIRSP